jgi:hypothetical protein
MPLRATDQSLWRHSAADPCWAGQESGGLDWDLWPVAAITDTLTPEPKDNYGEKQDGFFALKLMPAGDPANQSGTGRPERPARPCRITAFRRRSGCIPAEPYPPLKRSQIKAPRGLAPAPLKDRSLKCILEYPPQRHVRKKLDPQAARKPVAKREPPST